MFTVLTVEDRRKAAGIGKVLSSLSGNSLYLSRGEQGISYLRLVRRCEKINWRRIGRAANKIGGKVVYTGGASVGEDAGFVPFEPYDLRQRLCSNMAIELLSIMEDVPRRLRVGIYDPAGDFTDLPGFLLRYTDNLCVVTKNCGIYSTLAQTIIDETGAVLRVSRSVSALSDCGLIISPVVIRERFTPLSSAVVLTSCKPKIYLPCSVYYRYSLRLPKEAARLCPEDVDSEVFGGALYSLCGIYSLGSIVPFVCMNGENSQTTLSLRKFLREQFGT